MNYEQRTTINYNFLKFFVITVTLLLLLSNNILCQVVYTPLSSEVYEFLDRMSIKQIILLDDEVKPYSREYIAGLLKEIDEKIINGEIVDGKTICGIYLAKNSF